jgi:hypothetical protein
MTGRVQSLRSSVAGNRPTGRQPGELYVNWPDAQLGVINASNAAQDLIAVRFFSTLTSYSIGDCAVQAGAIYVAKSAVTAGAFNATQWTKIATADDIALYMPKAGGAFTGAVTLAADPTVALGAVTKQYSDTKLALAGGTLTGALVLAANPTLALGAATKQYADAKTLGVTDGSDAAAGQIGEVISSVVLSPGVSLGNGVAANITTIALTAGDWDVQGEVWIALAPAIVSILGWISPTSVSTGAQAALNAARFTVSGAAGFFTGTAALPFRPARVSLSAPATYYLGVTASGGASNTAWGNIWARRMR